MPYVITHKKNSFPYNSFTIYLAKNVSIITFYNTMVVPLWHLQSFILIEK